MSLFVCCRRPYDQHEMLVFAQQAGSLLQNVRRIRQVPRQRPEVSTSPNTFLYLLSLSIATLLFQISFDQCLSRRMENIFLKIESDRQNIYRLIKIRFLFIIIEISPFFFFFIYYMTNSRYTYDPNFILIKRTFLYNFWRIIKFRLVILFFT